MNRFWAIVFLLVPVLGVATFVVAPYFHHWLPTDVSAHGRVIDNLFYFILWLTGIVFVGTEVVLFIFLWRYNRKSRSADVLYTHGSHTLEVVWTILPAATLLFIAIYQMNAWAEARMDEPPGPPIAEVTGRQFEWRYRYPGKDKIMHTRDDVVGVNDLHLPINEEIKLIIRSEDVLHSFFLPNLRIKQDVVPGMKQTIWFKCNKEDPERGNKYDIVCAELCGWGHYKMKGQVTFLPREQFEQWLVEKAAEQQATTGPSGEEEE